MPNMAAETRPIDTEELEFFESEIRPLLANKCYSCHSAQSETKGKLKANLRLDSLQAILKGGDSGPALVPGDVNSLIIKAVGYLNEDMAMPPKGKLKAHEIQALTRCVELGAPWPGSSSMKLAQDHTNEEPYDWEALRKNHWAFRSLVKPPLPAVKNKQWAQSPIDLFILSGLEKAGVKPNPKATKRVLIRRAYLNLIGLPPPPEKVDAFLANQSPRAF